MSEQPISAKRHHKMLAVAAACILGAGVFAVASFDEKSERSKPPAAAAQKQSAGADAGGDASAGTADAVIAVEGQEIPEQNFVSAVAGLCLASEKFLTSPAEAETTYEQRSEKTAKTAVRVLSPSYSIIASRISGLIGIVDGSFAINPPAPTAGDDLSRLAAAMREGLARLAITTQPCRHSPYPQ